MISSATIDVFVQGCSDEAETVLRVRRNKTSRIKMLLARENNLVCTALSLITSPRGQQ